MLLMIVECHNEGILEKGVNEGVDVDCLDGEKGVHCYFRKQQDKAGVDIMLERLGLSVHTKEGMEVKLSDYLPEEDGDIRLSEEKCDKGMGEFRNLKGR